MAERDGSRRRMSKGECKARAKVALEASFESGAILELMAEFRHQDQEDAKLVHRTLLRRLNDLNSIMMDVLAYPMGETGAVDADELRAMFNGAR